MIHWDDKDGLLSLANIVPGHNLREVRELPGFDSWGVDYKPGSRPDVLWIGDGSNDFNSKCYPFMAAHEALHSIATLYTEFDDYQFFLYNICEDWRVNTCLLGIYGDLAESYGALKKVVLRRWQGKPLQLKSPISIALQHLCYMNHMFSPKAPVPESANDYFQEMLFLREEFGDPDNWPLVKNDPDRGAVNHETDRRLLHKIKGKKKPRNINIEEIRKLIHQMGYDLTSFKAELEVEGKVEIKKLDERTHNPPNPLPPGTPIIEPAETKTRMEEQKPDKGQERNITHD